MWKKSYCNVFHVITLNVSFASISVLLLKLNEILPPTTKHNYYAYQVCVKSRERRNVGYGHSLSTYATISQSNRCVQLSAGASFPWQQMTSRKRSIQLVRVSRDAANGPECDRTQHEDCSDRPGMNFILRRKKITLFG